MTYLLVTEDDKYRLVRPAAIWDHEDATSVLVWVEQGTDAVIFLKDGVRVYPVEDLLAKFHGEV